MRPGQPRSLFVSVGLGGVDIVENALGDQAGILAYGAFDLVGDIRVFLQELLGVLAPLPQTLALVAEPGARFLHHASLDAEIDKLADLRNAFAIHDVEFDLLEGRRDLVLDHLDAGLVTDDLFTVLDGADAADIEADRGVELERIAARRGFRAAIHNADLHADL